MSFRVALVQVGSTKDKQHNLKLAESYMQKAAGGGADLVVYPEIFMAHLPQGTSLEEQYAIAESLDGPFATTMAVFAKRHSVWTIFGMRERAHEKSQRAYNTTVVLDEQGRQVGVYRKTHLYDAFGAKESTSIAPGDKLFSPIETPFGRLGLFVCYELRFPEVAREQMARGADFLVVPSGWVRGSLKEEHWQHLITTRAIENTTFVIACDQVSDYYCGRSLVVDPMGVAIAAAGEEEQIIFCDIDTDRISSVRAKLPSYQHRRPELYTALRT